MWSLPDEFMSDLEIRQTNSPCYATWNIRLQGVFTARTNLGLSPWCRALFFCFALGCFLSIFFAVEGISTSDFAFAIAYIAVFVIAAIKFLGPLSRVADSVENDLIHDLNEPVCIAASRSLIGDLLLAHLRELGWGFRFGGSLIDGPKVMSTLGALVISAVSAIAQQVAKLA